MVVQGGWAFYYWRGTPAGRARLGGLGVKHIISVCDRAVQHVRELQSLEPQTLLKEDLVRFHASLAPDQLTQWGVKWK